jgi:hypothetical protein
MTSCLQILPSGVIRVNTEFDVEIHAIDEKLSLSLDGVNPAKEDGLEGTLSVSTACFRRSCSI